MAARNLTNSSLLCERLLGKVALVTGGSNAIGESIVRLFLKHGAKVCATDILDDVGHCLVESLCNDGYDVTYFHCDASIEEDVKQAVDHTVDKFGSLDIMVNKAAQREPPNPDVRDFQLSELEQIFNVNVKGVFSGMKHAARVMIPAKKGAIISICSISSDVVGGVGHHAYAGSKHAIVGLTRSVAAELGKHGIRVNCVSPYGIATGVALCVLREDKRNDEEEIGGFRCDLVSDANLKGVELAAHEDVANVVAFLASDEARYVSGSNLVVDGGFSSVSHSFGLFG